MRGVQLQEPRPDDFRRVIIPGHTDHLPVGTDGIHHELHQFVQPIFIQLHILRKNIIFDVLQNQCPIAFPLSHPVLSGPFLGAGDLIG